MKPTIYLAAPFSHASMVDTQISAAVTARGWSVSSTWHAPPYAPENLEAMPLEEVRKLATRNDDDLVRSDAVLVLGDGPGRETWCELRMSAHYGIPAVVVVPCGSFPLSAYRHRVTRCTTLSTAYDVLAGWAIERRAAS